VARYLIGCGERRRRRDRLIAIRRQVALRSALVMRVGHMSTPNSRERTCANA
jgi:hypothetical protein